MGDEMPPAARVPYEPPLGRRLDRHQPRLGSVNALAAAVHPGTIENRAIAQAGARDRLSRDASGLPMASQWSAACIMKAIAPDGHRTRDHEP